MGAAKEHVKETFTETAKEDGGGAALRGVSNGRAGSTLCVLCDMDKWLQNGGS